jgi:hypothetical protein
MMDIHKENINRCIILCHGNMGGSKTSESESESRTRKRMEGLGEKRNQPAGGREWVMDPGHAAVAVADTWSRHVFQASRAFPGADVSDG